METAKDIMTRDPACCSPDTPLPEVAQMMVEHDCGEIPVLDDGAKPIGVVTDRDITCRVVAQRKNPIEQTARDCMSSPCVTVREDASIDECIRVLEQNMIRRIPVVDAEGRCCGIVSQADIARSGGEAKAAELVRTVSVPTEAASNCC